jgi:hypothetical protein
MQHILAVSAGAAGRSGGCAARPVFRAVDARVAVAFCARRTTVPVFDTVVSVVSNILGLIVVEWISLKISAAYISIVSYTASSAARRV